MCKIFCAVLFLKKLTSTNNINKDENKTSGVKNDLLLFVSPKTYKFFDDETIDVFVVALSAFIKFSGKNCC